MAKRKITDALCTVGHKKKLEYHSTSSITIWCHSNKLTHPLQQIGSIVRKS